MQSLWSDGEARSAVDRYGRDGVNEDVSLRVYTTRLLGGDPRLVLHGGGNTSVKTRVTDVTGASVDVLCVKGSGWDMASIEPPGLPAVALAPLQELLRLEALTDEDMVNVQRRNLLDSTAPNPSVETLLHAFLPHKFIDHTHANAVLALTDQPDGEAICREVYGDRVALVPYIMPGFDLAKKAAEVHEQRGPCEGMILLKHGIFSFGETAQEAYERMVALVTFAEERIGRDRKRIFAPRDLPPALARPAEIAPVLRGLLARQIGPSEGLFTRFVLAFRTSPEIRAYVAGRELERYGLAGTITPDHAIRTKPTPVILPPPEAGDLDAFAEAARQVIGDYETRYQAYFSRNNERIGGTKKPLDPAPRVLLVPGLGIFTAGENAKAAAIAADLAEASVEVIGNAEAIGRFESISDSEMFDIEYWSLEQAKLGKGTEKPLARHVAVVTGAAGAIGRATAAAFREAGAEVALLDLSAEQVAIAARDTGGRGFVCDVTSPASVEAAFAAICEAFGGIDIVVSNAGAAWQGRIGEVADDILRQSFELNFFAHQTVAKAGVAVMRRQKTGGVLLFNASKQAVNPGPNFGPYGLPKAATMALARQYALDYGSEGITANVVNADRIRSGLLTDAMIGSRSKARGVSEESYMRGNLLGREVTAADVAQAFVALALARKSTGAVMTVDGGNIAAALR